MAIFLPQVGGQYRDGTPDGPIQMNPLLNSYSPRLFGAPPQLTSLNDMRLLSSSAGTRPGPTGDFYLSQILQDAQIVNFVPGRAIFTGGMNNFFNTVRMAVQYLTAISRFDIFDGEGGSLRLGDTGAAVQAAQEKQNVIASSLASDEWKGAPGAFGSNFFTEEDGNSGADGQHEGYLSTIDSFFSGSSGATGTVAAALVTSMRYQQPFFNFESDWFTYIQNVKMMINTAVIMLGLQSACVRIGENYIPIGVDARAVENRDIWSRYKFITSTQGDSQGRGNITGIDHQTGDTNQYVSYMMDPTGVNESFTNQTGQSQIFGTIVNKGSDLGTEIAFLTNASVSAVDDAIINIAGGAVSAAQNVVSTLGGGVGRFTAAMAGSMARSFIGDHTIYPQIYQGSQATTDVSIKVRLQASAGDPFSYLTEILIPYFFLLGLVLPKMSRLNAAAYAYPPLVQCNIPGIWGTRLGIIKSVTATKNQDGRDASIHGYPLSLDLDISVGDLQHVLMTSPQNQVSTFLNNHTMFDYIAQCAGVDKYRVNGSMRLVARMALADSQLTPEAFFTNFGDAILNDVNTTVNRITGTGLL